MAVSLVDIAAARGIGIRPAEKDSCWWFDPLYCLSIFSA
jgi:hypothetical protein